MSAGDIVGGMNTALRAVYQSIRDLLARASRDEVRNRFQVGVLVAEVKRWPNKYGNGAVAALAKALSQDTQTLYRCATVAECWSVSQLDTLVLRHDEYGQPLSWSHFVLLANVSPARERKELFERCLNHSLSVRELVALIDARRRVQGTPGPTVTAPAAEQFVRATERLVAGAARAQRELLAELKAVSHDPEVARALLERAVAAQEQLQALTLKQLNRLRAELASTEESSVVKQAESRPCRLLAGIGPSATEARELAGS